MLAGHAVPKDKLLRAAFPGKTTADLNLHALDINLQQIHSLELFSVQKLRSQASLSS
jgi:hypothetical protein